MYCAQFVQHPVLIVVDASDDRRHHVHVVAQGLGDFRREPLQRVADIGEIDSFLGNCPFRASPSS